MYTVYALKSIAHHRIYVGMTNNMEKRLITHNAGKNKSTKPYRPFEVIYTEMVDTRVEARRREKYRKSGVGKEKLKKILL